MGGIIGQLVSVGQLGTSFPKSKSKETEVIWSLSLKMHFEGGHHHNSETRAVTKSRISANLNIQMQMTATRDQWLRVAAEYYGRHIVSFLAASTLFHHSKSRGMHYIIPHHSDAHTVS